MEPSYLPELFLSQHTADKVGRTSEDAESRQVSQVIALSTIADSLGASTLLAELVRVLHGYRGWGVPACIALAYRTTVVDASVIGTTRQVHTGFTIPDVTKTLTPKFI